jgi:hypothetical protein
MRRGSLRIRHAQDCAAEVEGRPKDPRLCTCSPLVVGRIGDISRSFGHLPRGWRETDLIEHERRLLELRDQVLSGRTPPPSRVVTLEEYVVPSWFNKLAIQVEMGRMSPNTFNKYEGDWRRHLKPAFGRLPLGAIDQARLVTYMNDKLRPASASPRSRTRSSRSAGSSPTRSARATSRRTRCGRRSEPATAAAAATRSSTSR